MYTIPDNQIDRATYKPVFGPCLPDETQELKNAVLQFAGCDIQVGKTPRGRMTIYRHKKELKGHQP